MLLIAADLATDTWPPAACVSRDLGVSLAVAQGNLSPVSYPDIILAQPRVLWLHNFESLDLGSI
jgi:hypothetical protein